MDVESTLREFLADYAARFNRGLGDAVAIDVEGTAAAFADCFIESSPIGVNCGKNDEQFRQLIPHGFDFYRSIGTKAMNVGSLDLTRLAEGHWAARVGWQSFYVKVDGSETRIDFDVIYLVRLLAGRPKIFAYITGDEQKVLKEHGLLPG